MKKLMLFILITTMLCGTQSCDHPKTRCRIVNQGITVVVTDYELNNYKDGIRGYHVGDTILLELRGHESRWKLSHSPYSKDTTFYGYTRGGYKEVITIAKAVILKM